MKGTVKNFFMRHAIKRAVKKTARALPSAYPMAGKPGRKKYTAQQILSVMKTKGINPEHRMYLLALFSSHNQFRNYCRHNGDTSDYYSLRKEIIIDLFHRSPGSNEKQFLRDFDFIHETGPSRDNVRHDDVDSGDDFFESTFDAADYDACE